MKPGPHEDSPEDTGWDEKDPLWRALGRAPLPEPDGWFAARTLARCRNEALAADSGGTVSLARVWRWALGGGVAICMALTLAVTQQVGWRRAGSRFANRVADWLLDKPPGLYLSSFRCMSAFVVEASLFNSSTMSGKNILSVFCNTSSSARLFRAFAMT